ncbi:MAG: Rrf2 family transcriptional regulator [Methylocystis sp.]
MRLTRHSDLAFRTLLYLAVAGPRGASIHAIATSYGVSEHHLRKVVMDLSRLGVVTATRGPGGGLQLARPAGEISIGALMRQIEPDFAMVECLGVEPERCVVQQCCGLKGVFRQALAAWFAVLDRYTLADAAGNPERLATALGIERPEDAGPPPP